MVTHLIAIRNLFISNFVLAAIHAGGSLPALDFLMTLTRLKSNYFVALALLAIAYSFTCAQATADDSQESTPLRILLITSGCCHDYDFQTKAMQLALKERGVSAKWDVVDEGGKGTSAQIDLYNNSDWAKGYDLVIHNECFANTTDSDYIRRITDAHREGVNAVVIHCAMHTYRSAEIDDWRQFLGVTSRRHEHKSHYPIDVVEQKHPIMKGFPSGYRSALDELYIIEKVWPNTVVLATSTSEKTGKKHPVIWTNQFDKCRVFGTTYGHSNETFSDKVFLQTLTNGVMWAAGRLE